MSEGATRTRQIGLLARAKARRRRTPRHSGSRLAIEEIHLDIVHVGASHPFLVERKDLRRTVQNGETLGCTSEPFGPPTSTSCQFQDRARGSEGGESVIHDRYLAPPFEQLFLTPVEPAMSLPPFVVLRRSSTMYDRCSASRPSSSTSTVSRSE